MKKNLIFLTAATLICSLCFIQCGNNKKAEKEAEKSLKQEVAPTENTQVAAPEETTKAATQEAEAQAEEAYDIAVIKNDKSFTAPVFTDKTGKVGDENLFVRYVFGELVYPESCKDDGTDGTVLVAFEVNKEGRVENVKTVKSADPRLDEAALKAVTSSPQWTPAKDAGGNPVAVRYIIPIKFILK